MRLLWINKLVFTGMDGRLQVSAAMYNDLLFVVCSTPSFLQSRLMASLCMILSKALLMVTVFCSF